MEVRDWNDFFSLGLPLSFWEVPFSFYPIGIKKGVLSSSAHH